MRVRDLSLCVSLVIWPAIVSAEDEASVLEDVRNSVVRIETLDEDGSHVGTGTGFAVDKAVIATNVHVLKGGRRFRVIRSDGKKAIIRGIWAYDARNDVAIAQLSNPDDAGDIPPLELAEDDQIKLGNAVYAIGHPQGLNYTVSKGIISNTRRHLRDVYEEFDMPGIDDVKGVYVLQTDAATAPGSSGGPWVNSEGKVVGVHFAGLSKKQGFNFAAHVTHFKRLVNRPRGKMLDVDFFSVGPKLENGEWLTIFRSADPSIWNSDHNEGDDHFAMKLSEVPEGVEWLRLKRVDTGEFVIMPMQKQLLSKEVELRDMRWVGTAHLQRVRLASQDRIFENRTLGVANMLWKAPYKSTVLVCRKPVDRKGASGYAGWGFGKFSHVYSSQNFTWAGKKIAPTVFEIAVKRGHLKRHESRMLLAPASALKAFE